MTCRGEAHPRRRRRRRAARSRRARRRRGARRGAPARASASPRRRSRVAWFSAGPEPRASIAAKASAARPAPPPAAERGRVSASSVADDARGTFVTLLTTPPCVVRSPIRNGPFPIRQTTEQRVRRRAALSAPALALRAAQATPSPPRLDVASAGKLTFRFCATRSRTRKRP